MIPQLIYDFRHEIVITGLVSVFFGVIMYPINKGKKAVAKGREAWEALNGKLEVIHNDLSIQRNNCLATLQTQGDAQIELLKDAVGTLKNMSLSQARLLGRLDSVHVEFKE